jgi:D-alanyl-D-alanine carboxypeptidase
VVLGASSGQMRAVRAAQLLERGFANNTLSWLRPSLGTVDNLVPIDASPPNLRDEMCGGKHKRPASDEDEDTVASNAGASGSSTSGEAAITFFTAGLQPPMAKPSELLAGAAAPSEPIPVYTGPTKTGAALIAAVAVDAEKQTPRPRGKKSRVAAKKPDAAAEPKTEAKDAGKDAKSEPKSEPKSAAKPAAVGHASTKPESAPKAAEKPAKPAKPKAAAKPPTRPAPKSTTGDAKPADQKTAAAPRT